MADIKRDLSICEAEVIVPRGLDKKGNFSRTKTFKSVQSPQRFYDKDGLANIDLSFKNCSGKYFEFEYFCENNLVKSAFNDLSSDNPLASFILKADNTNNEKWINYKPWGCEDVQGIINNNEIIYENIYTDTDIKYINEVNNIKQFIILKSNQAPAIFEFTIKVSKGILLKEENNNIIAVNPDMPNSRTYWKINQPFATSNREGAEIKYGLVELINAEEHENGSYDVIRISIDSEWVTSEFNSGATEIIIDPTTYQYIRDYGNITFYGDFASGNQHGSNGFMNGYGLINRGVEAVQSGGTRVENDSASITYIDPDGTEYVGGAASKGVWAYYSTGSASGGSIHYSSDQFGSIKFTFTGTEVWMGIFYYNLNQVVSVYVDNEFYGFVDTYSSSNIWQHKLLLATGLSNSSHIVEVKVTSTNNISKTGSSQFNFDFFEYYTSGNELTSKNAITINSRLTYGLNCTFAKHPNGIQYDARGNLKNDTGGDNDKGSFSCWIEPNFNYNDNTDKYFIFAKEVDSEVAGDMRLYYDGSDDKFHLSIYNGADWTTVDAQSAAQTFSSGDVIHIACGWNETIGAFLYINNTKTSDSSTWTAVDLAGTLVIGNDAVSPSSSEEADMIIAEPTFFDYVLTDNEVYDIYTSTKPINELDFGRRVEVLNRTNKGLLFNYSGVMSPDHRIGSFAGKLYKTTTPAGTAITESQVTFSGTWTDVGNYRYTTDVNAYATTTFTGTECWISFYAATSLGIIECIIDEGTSKEKHIQIDQYHTGNEDRYALIATGLDNVAHTLKVRMKNLKNISSSASGIRIGINGSADKLFYYNTSNSISLDSLTFNNCLIDNVMKCEHSTMPQAIEFPDKGNISEYNHEGYISCKVKTSWAGDNADYHYIKDTTDGTDNGAKFYHYNGNLYLHYYNGAGGSINISGAVNGTNWAADTEHHLLIKWWRPTSSTMGLTIYLDGVKLAENKSQSLTPVDHSKILIGNSNSLNTTYDFEGLIHDLEIGNHAPNDGGVAVSASAAVGSEVYNSYHGICRKYLEDLSSQVDGSKTTFYFSRGLILNESDAKVYDDGLEATISSIKEGTYCRLNGAVNSTDTSFVVDSFTRDETEIDTNGGYLYIGNPVGNLWRKKIEYDTYNASTNTFTLPSGNTIGEDFTDNTIIEVCGTVTLSSAPAEGSILITDFQFAGDSVDREYGEISDRLNKNLHLDASGDATTGWQLASDTAKSGTQKIYSNVQGQTSLLNIDKSDFNISLEKDTNCGILQMIANQGTKDEKTLLLDNYNGSSVNQTVKSVFNGLPEQSIIRSVNGVDKNASASSYYSEIGADILSSQYDLTKDSLLSNTINSVFDFSAIRVVNGQLDYDRDKSGNLLLAEDLDAVETEIEIDTDTAADLDRLGIPFGIAKFDDEFIYYGAIEKTSSTTAILLNCIRGYLSELTGGVATTHSNNAAIQLVGAWRNNINAMSKSWYAQCGNFPYRALLIGCGTEGNVEGGLIIRDLDQDKNYMVFEAVDTNAVRGAVKSFGGHTGKIEIGYGTLAKGMTDVDFITDEILGHGTSGVGYGTAASTKGTISQRNNGLGWSYTDHTGVTLISDYINDIKINFDATNYNVWLSMGKSGATGSSAGVERVYDGGDGLLDTEYDLDADTDYWSTKLCYDIANDDLYVAQTNGTANQAIWSKIGTPKVTGDSDIDTADGSDRLTAQSICNDISLEALNIWFASDAGAKEVLKSAFSSGVTDTLDHNDFSAELSIDVCKAIQYDPKNSKLLLGFNNGSEGLLVECETDGSNPDYYDKLSETDVNRYNVLISDLINSVVYTYRE